MGKPDTPQPPAVAIAQENPDQPEIAAFLTASSDYAVSLYPPVSNHLVGLETLTAPNTCFLVARRSGAAVGCGALIVESDGSAELKRMWVAPESRGQGIGRALLSALEAEARNRAVTALRLETGIRQPAAIELYRSDGFVERTPFGSYQPDPLSLFMEKRLEIR
ncbi:MAG: GNAT family N-acetyltransferase [Hyphomicrobiaceae bacterium]